MSVGTVMNESESMEMLQGLMGDSFNAEVARRVLKMFNGDLQQAATAILEGDTGEISTPWQANTVSQVNYNSQASGSGSGALNAPRRTNTPCPTEEPRKEKEVIDLTGDFDPELNQALAMSLETESQQSQAVFRPTTRAPDPNWAVVPSNVPQGMTLTDAQAQDDQSLSRAIEASLNTSFFEDKYEELPYEDRIRQGDTPVALRTSVTEFYFTALVLQALYHIPQVREKVSQYQSKEDFGQTFEALNPGFNDGEYIMQSLCCLFTYLDLGIFSDIRIDQILMDLSPVYQGKRANSASENLGDLSNNFYTFIVRVIEEQLQKAGSSSSGRWDRLFHLRYAPTNAPLPAEDTKSNALGLDAPLPMSVLDIACVRVDVRGTDDTNDLISCLSTQLGLEVKGDLADILGLVTQSQSLVAPSDVVAFHLVRPSHHQGSSQIQIAGPSTQTQAQSASSSSSPFRYPKYVHLDQFLRENAELSSEKRTLRKELLKGIKDLTDKKNDLTRINGEDTLEALTSTVYYFENVASREGTETRAEEIKNAAMDLRRILTQVENEIQALDTKISKLKKHSESVFDDPALKEHRYDLRAVLVHDGLFGRNHIYSYVQHNDKWWKTQDAHVVEVSEETVLTDTTGLHLGAGPYMLFYSRATKENGVKLDWHSYFKETCEMENQDFIDRLDETAPEKAEHLRRVYKSVNDPRTTRVRKGSSGTSDASVGSTSTARPPSRSMSVESSPAPVEEASSPKTDPTISRSMSTEHMQVE